MLRIDSLITELRWKDGIRWKLSIKQILQVYLLNIKIYPLEMSNIQRGAAELNIISTRVDKSYI